MYRIAFSYAAAANALPPKGAGLVGGLVAQSLTRRKAGKRLLRKRALMVETLTVDLNPAMAIIETVVDFLLISDTAKHKLNHGGTVVGEHLAGGFLVGHLLSPWA
jgi:hypothetical protein